MFILPICLCAAGRVSLAASNALVHQDLSSFEYFQCRRAGAATANSDSVSAFQIRPMRSASKRRLTARVWRAWIKYVKSGALATHL